jgi:hypothetical protein
LEKIANIGVIIVVHQGVHGTTVKANIWPCHENFAKGSTGFFP